MTWQTRKSFVSSAERIKRIEKIPVIKGGQSSGAVAAYASKKDFGGISMLVEDGFATDIYLKKDDINKKMIITNSDYDADINTYSRISGGNITNFVGNGVIVSGKSEGSKQAVNNIKDFETAIVWYNGYWSIVRKLIKNQTLYIPVMLALKLISEAKTDTNIVTSLEKIKFSGTDFETVNSKELAEKMNMQELYSYWEFNNTLNIMINTDMKNGSYIFRRINNVFYIDMYFSFKENGKEYSSIKIDGICSELKYIEKIKEGFKLWENSGKSYKKENYADLGYDDIYVKINFPLNGINKINEIKYINSYSDDLRIKGKKQISQVDARNWSINNIGSMTIYNHYEGIPYTKESYVYVAAHEFGHLLGLSDAYEKDEETGELLTPENLEIPHEDIMRSGKDGTIVTPNDIEMLFFAVLKNKKQYFNNKKGEKSKAIDI